VRGRLLILFCFGALGVLTGYSSLENSQGLLVLCFVTGCLFGVGCLLLTSLPLHLFFRGVVSKNGAGAIGDCLNTGFLALVPFTLLAFLAELLLNWNATSAFASAGLMFCGGVTAGALAKADPGHPQGMLRALVPTLAAALASFCWLAMWAVFIPLLGRVAGA
jgi:hypothetical protein